MNKNYIIRKGLVIGVLFLFLGITVPPVTSIHIPQINEFESIIEINNFYHEEICNCEDVNPQDVVEINRLLDKTECIINIILLTFGYIPDVRLKCNELLPLVDMHGNHGPICTLLGLLWIGTFLIWMDIDGMFYTFNEKGRHLLASICLLIYNSIEITIIGPVLFIAVGLNCDWTLYPEMTLGLFS